MNTKHRVAMMFVIGCAIAGVVPAAQAAEHTVEQKDKKFSKPKLAVKVGDSISFKNADPFFHNVFSISDAKSFDLGSYPQGQVKSVTFDKPGTVEVECAVHPSMNMVVEVGK